MASIFTFDPSPPSVSSPWSTPRTSTPRPQGRANSSPGPSQTISSLSISDSAYDDPDLIVTSLEAEPQEGPTEYKLHLLLRRRRSFTHISTRSQVSGSHRSPALLPRSQSGTSSRTQQIDSPGPQHLASSNQSRHMRLEQLTTQLLWRLQQSSSYHSTSYKPSSKSIQDLLISGDDIPVQTLCPGLEDSKGALYEIGVADDGTFVGLAEDELEESLQTLRTMAGSLGCTVSVLRRVIVGDCEWSEHGPNDQHRIRQSPLWVAEAYVRPTIGDERGGIEAQHTDASIDSDSASSIEQLRITLTGPTMSGKSSLLGTLTTATLDNGRGKSRLSLLKHQHEIASGMTSSVTHELLGYSHIDDIVGDSHVVNFASANVSSWTDIHSSCQGGRLVFFSDSAGHPRYRRTTVRGLIGWRPHWTLLCIPADAFEGSFANNENIGMSHEIAAAHSSDFDLYQEHLDLCLKLDLQMVVVITKVDLASRPVLRSHLNRILSLLKRAGRVPFILPEYGKETPESDMSTIQSKDLMNIQEHAYKLRHEPSRAVPIVLTSAVRGMGIKTLHVLLHDLPIPQASESIEDLPGNDTALFDIEDVYTGRDRKSDTNTLILSGSMRHGRINLGEELFIGPYFVQHVTSARSRNATIQSKTTAMSPASLPNVQIKARDEWFKVKISSVRHLRLPSRSLSRDQVGSIGVTPVDETSDKGWYNIRKGMILTSGMPDARRSFVAVFARSDVDPLSIGSNIVVYFNSVRASAKIIAGAIVPDNEGADRLSSSDEDEEGGFAFGFDEDEGGSSSELQAEREEKLLVTFQFIASREYVQIGTKILVMPGGGPGLGSYVGGNIKGMAGLTGFVGEIVNPS